MKWGDGLWLIKSTIADGGECHKDENGLVWLQTLTDSPHGKLYLTLNTGEKPRVENNTHLSQVLQEDVDPKYNLSPKACQGIINRANNRGKALPQVLMDALEEQING